MADSVLLLNADAQPLSFLPLSVISWQNAMKAYFQGKVKILETHPTRKLHSATLTFDLPTVVISTEYQKRPSHARFSRRNMYIRDNYVCQYCGNLFPYSELTIDHVVPRVDGGKTSWTNCVTCCKKCNTKKGRDYIKPLREPIRPSWHNINSRKSHRLSVSDPSWLQYLDWPEDLLNYHYDSLVAN